MLYSRMLRVGVTPDLITYTITILINILCNEGRIYEACNFWNGLNPDKISYTSIIATFCKIGDMKKAWGLFSEMLQTGHLPSVVTYTCLIDGFCKANWMDIAHLLADEMRRKKVSPDVFSYNVLIAGYRRLGNLDRAHELFKEMRKEGIFPNDYAFNILELDAASVKEN